MLYFLLFSTLLAETPEPANMEILVQSDEDYEVYIAPIQYHIFNDKLSVSVPHQMVFNYAGMHSKGAKVATANGMIYEPITMHGGMMVYNKDTIKYTWDDCDYAKDYAGCSRKNSHYFVETHVTVTNEEIVISMTLFNEDMQPINNSQRSSKKIINWIKQQELTVIQEQGLLGSRTTIHKPKEELPLKWEIPPRLLSNMIYQASLGLWTGVKIN